MTAADASRMHVTLHLLHDPDVSFDAGELWPLHGAYARFGNDLPSFAEEIGRRLHTEGFIGFSPEPDTITIIPGHVVRRVDFVLTAPLPPADFPEQ
jgi:hypothetical protein